MSSTFSAKQAFFLYLNNRIVAANAPRTATALTPPAIPTVSLEMDESLIVPPTNRGEEEDALEEETNEGVCRTAEGLALEKGVVEVIGVGEDVGITNETEGVREVDGKMEADVAVCGDDTEGVREVGAADADGVKEETFWPKII